jgi:hypothetical protein
MVAYVYIDAGMNVSLPPSFGGGSVMMWSTISNDRKIDLVHVPGNLTAVRYRDEILQPHLMHVIVHQRELFQQDNTQRV